MKKTLLSERTNGVTNELMANALTALGQYKDIKGGAHGR